MLRPHLLSLVFDKRVSLTSQCEHSKPSGEGQVHNFPMLAVLCSLVVSSFMFAFECQIDSMESFDREDNHGASWPSVGDMELHAYSMHHSSISRGTCLIF